MNTFFQVIGYAALLAIICWIIYAALRLYGYNVYFFITRKKLDKGKLKGLRKGTAHLAWNRTSGPCRNTDIWPRGKNQSREFRDVLPDPLEQWDEGEQT